MWGRSHPVRVLVVDDEPDIRRVMSRALTTQGIKVDSAADAAGALQQLGRASYDLVLLDVLMPGTSGVDLLATVLRQVPDQRVMMVSALNEPRVRVTCLESGAVDYLSKPFVLAELVARVRVHARRDPPAVPAQRVERRRGERRVGGRRAVDRVGGDLSAHPGDGRFLRRSGVTLDLRVRRVTVGAVDVALSERECLVLAHLMRGARDVCTREEILREVWGASGGQSSNVVDVYVGRLRGKLPAGTITTVRNAGYAFDDA